MAAADYAVVVQQLYVAYFGRPADTKGLTDFQNLLNATGVKADIASVEAAYRTSTAVRNAVDAFGNSPESSTLYGNGNNLAFVKAIYANVLNRTPADADAGLKFWVDALTSGAVTKGNIALSIMAAAKINTSEQGKIDALTVDKKIAVAGNFTVAIATLNATFSGDAATLAARDLLAKVTNTTDATAFQTQVEDCLLSLTPGQTFTLTTGATDEKVGGDASDTFSAVASSLVSEGSLQVTDKVDGGKGSDALTVDMSQGFTGFTTGYVKNVESIKLNNKGTAALNFDATGVTGALEYVIDSTKGVISLSDLNALAEVDVTGPTGTSTLTVAYDATSTVATGTQTDVQSLQVKDVGSIDSDGVASTTNAKYMTVNIAKVEGLAVETFGTANSLNLSGVTDAKTITVKGVGQTEIAAVGTAVTSFDASGAKGNVIANLTAAADGALTTVKSGAGDDTITVAMGDLSATATVDGGAGKDTLIVTGAAGTIQPSFAGFETVTVSGISSALTFSGTNTSGIENVNVSGTNTAGASFVNMGEKALNVTTVGQQNNALSADNKAAVTFNTNTAASATSTVTTNTGVTAAFDGATALTVNVGAYADLQGNVSAAAAKDVAINVASKVVNSVEQTKLTGVVTAGEATSFTVKAEGQLAAGSGISAAKATTGTLVTGSSSNADFDITAAKMHTLTVTAGKGLDLSGSTLTGLQNLTVTTAGAFTVGAVNLVDAAAVTVSGTAATSAATFAELGATGLTHNVNLTATGLKGGLTTGAIKAGTAAAAVDISGVTGNVTLGAITADAGITLNAKTLGGTLANGAAALTTTKGSISVDVSNAVKSVTLGALTTDGAGDVSLLAGNALSTVTVGVITGKNVTVNGSGALGAVTVGNGTTAGTDIVAGASVTYSGSNLNDNGVNIATAADSTDFVANLTGGAKNEVITIAGAATQKSITVSGNLGAGTNSVAVTLANQTSATTAQVVNLSGLTGSDKTTTTTSTNLSAEVDGAITYTGSAMNDSITFAAAADVSHDKAISISDATLTDSDTLTLGGGAGNIALTNLSLSGIENLIVSSAAKTVSINASAISGKAIAVSAASANQILSLTGTDGADVITLAAVTDGGNDAAFNVTLGAGNDTFIGSLFADTITGGAGADTLTGGAGADTFVVAAGSGSASGVAAGSFTGYDTITDFTTTSDKIKFLAGGAVNTAAAAQVAADNTAYVFSNAQVVNGAAVTTLAAADFANVDKVVSFINGVASNTAAAGMDFIVAVNDATAGKAAIYHITNVTGDAVIAAEVQLLGVTTGVVATADFIA